MCPAAPSEDHTTFEAEYSFSSPQWREITPTPYSVTVQNCTLPETKLANDVSSTDQRDLSPRLHTSHWQAPLN